MSIEISVILEKYAKNKKAIYFLIFLVVLSIGSIGGSNYIQNQVYANYLRIFGFICLILIFITILTLSIYESIRYYFYELIVSLNKFRFKMFMLIVAKKDMIIKFMYISSKALFLSVFIFISFSIYVSILSPSLGSSIKGEQIKLLLSIILYASFLITFALSYRIKIPNEYLTKLEGFYPEVPFILMGIGYSTLLIMLYLSVYSYALPPPRSLLGFLMGFTLLLVPIGIFLLIITLSAKRSLESRVFFTLKKANVILDQVEDKNQIDTKNLERYIYLTYRNIKNKIGKRLNFKSSGKSDGISNLDLEYTFLNYLPYYIEFASKEQLQSLKNNLETMLNSVNENDEIKWGSLIPGIFKLNDDIIMYLQESNFDLTYQKSRRQLEWIHKNKEAIVQIIGLSVPIILFILSKLYPLP